MWAEEFLTDFRHHKDGDYAKFYNMESNKNPIVLFIIDCTLDARYLLFPKHFLLTSHFREEVDQLLGSF